MQEKIRQISPISDQNNAPNTTSFITSPSPFTSPAAPTRPPHAAMFGVSISSRSRHPDPYPPIDPDLHLPSPPTKPAKENRLVICTVLILISLVAVLVGVLIFNCVSREVDPDLTVRRC